MESWNSARYWSSGLASTEFISSNKHSPTSTNISSTIKAKLARSSTSTPIRTSRPISRISSSKSSMIYSLGHPTRKETPWSSSFLRSTWSNSKSYSDTTPSQESSMCSKNNSDPSTNCILSSKGKSTIQTSIPSVSLSNVWSEIEHPQWHSNSLNSSKTIHNPIRTKTI